MTSSSSKGSTLNSNRGFAAGAMSVGAGRGRGRVQQRGDRLRGPLETARGRGRRRRVYPGAVSTKGNPCPPDPIPPAWRRQSPRVTSRWSVEWHYHRQSPPHGSDSAQSRRSHMVACLDPRSAPSRDSRRGRAGSELGPGDWGCTAHHEPELPKATTSALIRQSGDCVCRTGVFGSLLL